MPAGRRHLIERRPQPGGAGLVLFAPYGVVRHPFYAADPLIFLGLSLWLESDVAMMFAIAPIALMMVRLTLEERCLGAALPGYGEYTRRVHYRLVPVVGGHDDVFDNPTFAPAYRTFIRSVQANAPAP
ncbi:hypothetical protein BH11GEM1_BH11GEM1_08700 [soil metagenome]